MLLLWIAFSLTWPGTIGFMIHNVMENLCLEDSNKGGVQLQKCSQDTVLQQWMWTDSWFLVNVGTLRCLSAAQSDPVQTITCNSGDHIMWQCKDQQLISLTNSLALITEGGKLSLNRGEHNKWKSLDADDICQDKLRSRSETDEFDFAETEGPSAPQGMSEAQMRFLQWYYRTEDPTLWKFAMLAFAFLGLLIGCMLQVMATMANRNRKQIAKYKASINVTEVKPEMVELQAQRVKEEKPSSTTPTQNSHTDWEESPTNSKVTEELRPGEIMVTWKDGNVSTLYPEPVQEGEGEEEEVHQNFT
ncbi:uncharacterized protein LOC127445626 [Myxocyprinus asiaticus]|uniref:uncharacterized protein LOC127445626 n=1 Tax=Myxocyprinus asiaticus TaxID=70543 RepID=UPI002222232C|nr:uncharacterized protein LOC127445626 [Myxocyprinus asiaticus]